MQLICRVAGPIDQVTGPTVVKLLNSKICRVVACLGRVNMNGLIKLHQVDTTIVTSQISILTQFGR